VADAIAAGGRQPDVLGEACLSRNVRAPSVIPFLPSLADVEILLHAAPCPAVRRRARFVRAAIFIRVLPPAQISPYGLPFCYE